MSPGEDILSRATRELRTKSDATNGESATANVTRTRIMMSLRQQERRRLAAIYVLLPAAAVLVASTAWAAASGRLPTVMKTIGAKLGLMEAPSSSLPMSPPTTAPKAKPTGSGALASAANTEEPQAPSAPAPAEPPAAADVPPSANVANSAKSHASAAPAPHPSDEPGFKLYEAAHRAHFGARDWNAALAGWDRYLATAPHGRFAPEARYNRAIALLRLDRRDEAIRELTPFAEGRYGGYRQSEARGLIEAMSGANK
ncbi:tol-pal system YbgF family protein [Pendulispora albinea]|uniref:Uncharacterized protein n=1 Tax=Pendulispora albinea TaxID=2741071 RepID=A0ABZ2LW75_9BACT